MADVPNLFILGAPKTGTTAMWTYLGSHPDIFMGKKEMHYFGEDLYFTQKKRVNREQYLANFDAAGNERYRGDCAIWYLYSETAARELAAARPDAKAIALLRRPDEMIYSLYSEHLYQADEDLPDLASALDAEEDRRNGKRIPPNCDVPWALQYSRVARYADQLARYHAVFAPEQLHVVLYDDLANDTAGVYREILRFLEIDDTFQPELEVVNPNMVVRSPGFRDFLRNPPAPVRAIGRALVRDQRVRRALGHRVNSLNSVTTERPPLDPSVRARLQAIYASQIDELEDLLHRDLGAWRQSPGT
jgi:hypothetical protein